MANLFSNYLPNPFNLFNKNIEGLTGSQDVRGGGKGGGKGGGRDKIDVDRRGGGGKDKKGSPTTPNATTPNVTTPNVTTPNVTTPNATTPNATTPNATTSPTGGYLPVPNCAAPPTPIQKKTKFITITLIIAFIILFGVLSMFYYAYDRYMLPILIENNVFTSIAGGKNYFFDKTSIKMGKAGIFVVLWLIVCVIVYFTLDLSPSLKTETWGNVIKTTSIYYFGIVASTFIIIGQIPSLVEIFENTIGYWIIKFSFVSYIGGLPYLKETMDMFKSKSFENIKDDANYEIPFDVLLTTFDLPAFHDTYDSLNANQIDKDFYIAETTEKKKNDLLHLVLAKNNIGHMVWIYIASIITILATVNSIA